jgi:hypothetical protein
LRTCKSKVKDPCRRRVVCDTMCGCTRRQGHQRIQHYRNKLILVFESITKCFDRFYVYHDLPVHNNVTAVVTTILLLRSLWKLDVKMWMYDYHICWSISTIKSDEFVNIGIAHLRCLRELQRRSRAVSIGTGQRSQSHLLARKQSPMIAEVDYFRSPQSSLPWRCLKAKLYTSRTSAYRPRTIVTMKKSNFLYP